MNVSPAGGALGIDPASGLLAFGAGVVSLLSPCVLALVPAYLGYLSASALSEPSRSRLLFRSLLFVAGFSAIFVLLGASATAAGRSFLAYQPLMRRLAGVLVALLGLHQLGVVRLGFLDVERRLVARLPGGSGGWVARPWGAALLGMAFAVGWSPCVGPVLASILMLAGTAETVGKGMALLALYAAGMGLPFMGMAALMGNGAERVTRRLMRRGRWVERISGVLMIAIGVMLYTNFFLRLPAYLNYYRWFGL